MRLCVNSLSCFLLCLCEGLCVSKHALSQRLIFLSGLMTFSSFMEACVRLLCQSLENSEIPFLAENFFSLLPVLCWNLKGKAYTQKSCTRVHDWFILQFIFSPLYHVFLPFSHLFNKFWNYLKLLEKLKNRQLLKNQYSDFLVHNIFMCHLFFYRNFCLNHIKSELQARVTLSC